MNEILFLCFVSVLLLIIVLGLLLAYTLLFRTQFFLMHVFPQNPPKAAMFFSKEKGSGDYFVLYFGLRFFVLGILLLLVILIFRSAI